MLDYWGRVQRRCCAAHLGPTSGLLFYMNYSFCFSRRICGPHNNSCSSEIISYVFRPYFSWKCTLKKLLHVIFLKKISSMVTDEIVNDIRSTWLFTWNTYSTRLTKLTIRIKNRTRGGPQMGCTTQTLNPS